MVKRRKNITPHAGTLPLILQDLAIAYETPTLKRGSLWWITLPMAQMTAAAAESMPDDAPIEDFMPSDQGLVWVDGGTGISLYDQGSKADEHIYGACWAQLDGLRIIPLTRRPKHQSDLRGRHGTDAGLIFPDTEHHALPDRWERLSAWLATAFALAELPTIARTRRDRVPGMELPRRPDNLTKISIVTLREAHHDPADPSGDDPQKRRELQARHLVRGHWRNQACGPDRSERKRIFVMPYTQGPSGAPLVSKPRVHVWRR